MKDYYKIMDVPYYASAEDIRRAYHRQAKKWHPDRNPHNLQAASIFLEIQEAYEVLSDESKRFKFHQQTHYPFLDKKLPVETSETLLFKSRQLDEQVSHTNLFRVNPMVIAQSVHHLLSENNLAILAREGRLVDQEKIIRHLLGVLKPLPYKTMLPIISRLLLLAGNHYTSRQGILAFADQKRKKRYWERYNMAIILLATVLICVLIVLLA